MLHRKCNPLEKRINELSQICRGGQSGCEPEIYNFGRQGGWGFEGLLCRPPMGFGAKPRKMLALTRFFFISNSIFRINVRVPWQIYVFNVKSCLVVAQQFPLCKINNFSIVTSICLKYCCTKSSCTKNSCEEIQLWQT